MEETSEPEVRQRHTTEEAKPEATGDFTSVRRIDLY